jgi:23S rRNA pseudouridine1911/1915/1917 synthase
MCALLNIVHEDPDLLVVNKPADLVCHPTKQGPLSSLISRARLHCGGEIQPQLVNRLDRETSGLVLLAKNEETARELRRLFESRAVSKTYLAIVHGHLAEEQVIIDAPLGPDERSAVAIKSTVRPDGQPAQTAAQVLRRFSRPEGNFTLLSVQPLTGRKHQIRIHLAHLGHPVVGDKIYGGDERLYLDFVESRLDDAQRARLLLPSQALHAARLRFAWRNSAVAFTASPGQDFINFLASEGEC